MQVDPAKAAGRAEHEGRAYFFHLLYWTLRKLRHSSFPHVKRVLAFYSACQICQNLALWKKP